MKIKDGKLNMMLQLSVLKGKSIAYVFNNKKIMQIIQIKKKKQQVLDNFDEIRDKLKNWRKMKKTVIEEGINTLIDDEVEKVEYEHQEVLAIEENYTSRNDSYISPEIVLKH